MTRAGSLAAGILPGAVIVAVLTALVVWARPLAERLVRENEAIEWLQVALLLIAFVFVLWSAARRFSPADVLLAALVADLAAFEIDLDRRVIGVSLVDWRLFSRSTVPLPSRILAVTAILGAALALTVYAVLRRQALFEEAREALRLAWGRLLLAGVVLFGLAQPCDPCLNRLVPLPQSFLEESLELLGTIYLAFATGARALAPRAMSGRVSGRVPG